MESALFDLDGDRFVPTQAALSPWGSDRLHGGPVLGLMTHVGLSAVPDPAFQLARVTVDLFAPVPNEPLAVHSQVVRDGKRIRVVTAAITGSRGEAARAGLVFLRAGSGTHRVLDGSVPAGPDGLLTRTLIGERRADQVRPGFHLEVETRWPERESGGPRAIWFRMPMACVSGHPLHPTVAAVALSDFNNAISSIQAYEDGRPAGHINVDSTFYMERQPVGEWFCLVGSAQSDADAISISHVTHHDEVGRFGHSLQARLENAFK